LSSYQCHCYSTLEVHRGFAWFPKLPSGGTEKDLRSCGSRKSLLFRDWKGASERFVVAMT